METELNSQINELEERIPEGLVDRSWRNCLLLIGIPGAVFCCFPIVVAAYGSPEELNGLMRWFGAFFMSGMMLCVLGLLLFSNASILQSACPGFRPP